jgi:hypothetical protein
VKLFREVYPLLEISRARIAAADPELPKQNLKIMLGHVVMTSIEERRHS